MPSAATRSRSSATPPPASAPPCSSSSPGRPAAAPDRCRPQRERGPPIRRAGDLSPPAPYNLLTAKRATNELSPTPLSREIEREPTPAATAPPESRRPLWREGIGGGG